LFWLGIATVSIGQPILSAQNMSLGGAGVAYSEGIASIHLNPANLQMHDTSKTIAIRIGTGGAQFDPIESRAKPRDQWNNFKQYLQVHDPTPATIGFTDLSRLQYLQNQYPGNATRAHYSARVEIQPVAVSYHTNRYSLGISFRTRIANRMVVGKGWFSPETVDSEEKGALLDRTLDQQYQSFHEISFSYAQPLTYLNGLTSNLGKFYVGISPKFLFGGTFMDVQYQNNYLTQPEGNKNIRSLAFRGSGTYSLLTDDLRRGISASQAIKENLDAESLLESTGYGIGIDFGLTYTYPLGGEIQLQDGEVLFRQKNQKALRLSLSASDIGFFNHQDSPRVFKTLKDTNKTGPPGQLTLSSEKFTGAPGQFYHWIEKYSMMDQPFQSSVLETNSFMQMLPASLQGGIALLYDRLTVTADLQTTLVQSVFYGSGLSFHSGIEYYLVKQWPIRAGLQIRKNNNSRLSFGTGFEARHWAITTGIQISGETNRVNTDLYGAAFAAITMNL